MPEPNYYIKRGDFGSTIAIVCEDEDGTAVNLEGATVQFRMTPLSRSLTVVDSDANNDQNTSDPETYGEVSYVWAEGDSDHASGLYLAEFEVTYVDQSVVTYPNGGYIMVMITEDIAALQVTSSSSTTSLQPTSDSKS